MKLIQEYLIFNLFQSKYKLKILRASHFTLIKKVRSWTFGCAILKGRK